jgi:glycosyltransferase involved in cell wall biosynthesis
MNAERPAPPEQGRGALSAFKIDVIVPVRNGEKYIAEALGSVLAQIYLPEKIIVVNDGSTDATESVVLEVKSRSLIPVIYLKNLGSGRCSARNCGLRSVTSEYVAFLDADDVWLPDKLAEQVRVFENSPFRKLGVVYCDYAVIDEHGNKAAAAHVIHPGRETRGDVFLKLLGGNLISGSCSAALVKRECFTAAGYFDESLNAAEDWDMWLRIAKIFQFDYSDKTLVKLRIHPDNTQHDTVHMLDNEILFFNKWSGSFDGRAWHRWGKNLMCRVVNALPDLGVYNKVRAEFSESSRERLFSACFGSMRLYFIAAVWYIRTKRAFLRVFNFGKA